MPDVTTAMLLTAGLGTRLRPLTLVRAKPAIPVAGEPIVRRILGSLAGHGVRDAVLNLHHLPHTITAVVGDGLDLGVRVRYSWEQPDVLGSAGGPRLALPLLDADRFFLLNGDTLTDFDLSRLAAAHQASDAAVTLAVTPNHEPLRYGGIVASRDGVVTGFVRRGPAAVGSCHFVGVQVVNREAFAWLPAGEPFNSIGYSYDRLVAEHPGSVRVLAVDTRFWDIGTVADYLDTSRQLSTPADGHLRAGATIAPDATVTGSILWDDITVGAGASIERCIITDGVQVPAGAVYRDCILMTSGNGIDALPLDRA